MVVTDPEITTVSPARRLHITEVPGRIKAKKSQRVDTTLRAPASMKAFSTSITGASVVVRGYGDRTASWRVSWSQVARLRFSRFWTSTSSGRLLTKSLAGARQRHRRSEYPWTSTRHRICWLGFSKRYIAIPMTTSSRQTAAGQERSAESNLCGCRPSCATTSSRWSRDSASRNG
jgi:hypothetical protein